MGLEHALPQIVPGQEAACERACAQAQVRIRASAGFRSLRLGRSAEHPNRYRLLVEWEPREDHPPGFRGSPAYQEWRALRHHCYDPFPEVAHDVPVVRAAEVS